MENNVTMVSEAPVKARKNRPIKMEKPYKCSYCGEVGHNKRRCPKRLADEANKQQQDKFQPYLIKCPAPNERV